MSDFGIGFIGGFLVCLFLIVGVFYVSTLMFSSKLSQEEERWNND